MKTVAAFDFDGTISKRDTLIPFALYVHGFWRWLLGLIRLFPYGLLFLFRGMDRKELKEKTLTEFFQGMNIDDEANNFAELILPKLLKEKALKTIEWHKEQGHTLVLVSASPENYLIPWALKTGFTHILASKLETSEGKITGKLIGENCRGKEKVRRLKEIFGPEKSYELWAYGDSAGDAELLAFADHKFYRKI